MSLGRLCFNQCNIVIDVLEGGSKELELTMRKSNGVKEQRMFSEECRKPQSRARSTYHILSRQLLFDCLTELSKDVLRPCFVGIAVVTF